MMKFIINLVEFSLRWLLICFAILALLTLIFEPDHVLKAKSETQNIIHVPVDYGTIAEALAVAEAGDTVLVAEGIFDENLYVPAGIILEGAGKEESILQSSLGDSVVTLHDGSTIRGFTIRGGKTGIRVENSASVTIMENRIAEHSSKGVFIFCYSPDNCTGTQLITNNEIIGNATGVFGYMQSAQIVGGELTISHNQIKNNFNHGMLIQRSSVYIDHNIVTSNEVGMAIDGFDNITVENNTIVNQIRSGIECFSPDCHATIQNNIIANNKKYGIVGVSDSSQSSRYNLVWGNSQNNYQNISNIKNDINANPFFMDPENEDYHLLSASPAIGSGTPSGTDMGAFPFSPVATPPTELTISSDIEGNQTLTWDAVTDATSYTLWLGMETSSYIYAIDVGQKTTFVFHDLPAGITYHVAVSSNSEEGQSLPSTQKSFSIEPLTIAKNYYHTNSTIIAEGSWEEQEDASALGGSCLFSDQPGDRLTFIFYGDTMAFYRRVSQAGGEVQISLDGLNYSVLSSYFDYNQRSQVPAIYDHLGAQAHLLTITLLSSKDEESTGNEFCFEGFAAPSPFQPSADQKLAIEYINQIRTTMGLPPTRGTMALHKASTNHIIYYQTNKEFMTCPTCYHIEHFPDLPGYTGKTILDRARYTGARCISEEAGAPDGGSNPLNHIEGWIDSYGHRNGITGYWLVEQGFGLNTLGSNGGANLKGGACWPPRSLSTRSFFTLPANEQQDVRHYGYDPVGGQEFYGYIVSFYIVQPHDTPNLEAWQVDNFELRAQNGALVSVETAENAGPDPQQIDQINILPYSALEYNTTYTAFVSGIDSAGVPFEHTWSFTTEPKAKIQAHLRGMKLGNRELTLDWVTAGEAKSWVEYGPTTNYEFEKLSLPTYIYEKQGIQHHEAVFTSEELLEGVTYHYRLVAVDADGNKRMTEDSTMTLGKSIYLPMVKK